MASRGAQAVSGETQGPATSHCPLPTRNPVNPKLPPDHLVVFGRPGSGKTSLAERLGEDEGYQLVRTGELLRAAVRRRDFLGQRVEKHLASGNLVPDRLIFE